MKRRLGVMTRRDVFDIVVFLAVTVVLAVFAVLALGTQISFILTTTTGAL